MRIKWIKEAPDGHNAGTYSYLEDVTADLYIRQGIAEAAREGEKPDIPHKFSHWHLRRKA